MNCIVHGVAKSWTQLSDFKKKNSKSQLSLLVCVSMCVFSQFQFSRGKSLIGQTRSWGTAMLAAAAISPACSGNSAVPQRKKPGER